jgi:hypothetical protein
MSFRSRLGALSFYNKDRVSSYRYLVIYMYAYVYVCYLATYESCDVYLDYFYTFSVIYLEIFAI